MDEWWTSVGACMYVCMYVCLRACVSIISFSFDLRLGLIVRIVRVSGIVLDLVYDRSISRTAGRKRERINEG